MSCPGFFWYLVKRSFRGTLRVLEISEAIVALLVHVLGYFFPQHKESLEALFVVLIGLLILTFLVGIFLAAYAYIQEPEAKKARDVLEICRVPQRNPANEHRRVLVRNLLPNVTVRFGAELEAIKPAIKHDVPVRLQLTNTPRPHLEADLPPGKTHPVDVFVEEPGGGDRIGLLLATDDCVLNNRPLYIDRQRYELRISAFTVTGSQVYGKTASHYFSIIPQADGSVIFSDAGD